MFSACAKDFGLKTVPGRVLHVCEGLQPAFAGWVFFGDLGGPRRMGAHLLIFFVHARTYIC